MNNIEISQDLINKLSICAYKVRKNLIQLAATKAIHIGGCLSACDILTVLWQTVIEYDFSDPRWEGRDRFLLSKGHCQAAVAFQMAAREGVFSDEEILNEYAMDNTRFSMSPCRHTNPYYESSCTGSLGQGLPLGCGISLALKSKGNNKSKVFVLLGDGELQEGSNWEAIMLAGDRNLDNLIAIIDNNGLQFDGNTKDIVDVENIDDRFSSFGWKTLSVDGHRIYDLLEAFQETQNVGRPIMINARTIKGKGVPYMENNYIWHAGKIRAEELAYTMEAFEKAYGRDGFV